VETRNATAPIASGPLAEHHQSHPQASQSNGRRDPYLDVCARYRLAIDRMIAANATGLEWRVFAVVTWLTLGWSKFEDSIPLKAFDDAGIYRRDLARARSRLVAEIGSITYKPSGGRKASVYGLPEPAGNTRSVRGPAGDTRRVEPQPAGFARRNLPGPPGASEVFSEEDHVCIGADADEPETFAALMTELPGKPLKGPKRVVVLDAWSRYPADVAHAVRDERTRSAGNPAGLLVVLIESGDYRRRKGEAKPSAFESLKRWARGEGRRLDPETQEWHVREAVRKSRVTEQEAEKVRSMLGL
jgi:hypothetical protein